jgi:hypothetical protein
LEDGSVLDTNMHSRHDAAGLLQCRKARKTREATEVQEFLTHILAMANPADMRQMLRAKETGMWLTTTPD